MNRKSIQGRWEILSWEQAYDDGRLVHPMGTELEGFIEYSEFGMFCVIARKSREPLSGGQWSASDSDKARAYNSYLTYAGGYDVKDGVIHHHVRHSLFPNWEGGTQKRVAIFNGDTLELTARLEEGTTEVRTARLSWKRAVAGSGA